MPITDFDPNEELGGTFAMDKERAGEDPNEPLRLSDDADDEK